MAPLLATFSLSRVFRASGLGTRGLSVRRLGKIPNTPGALMENAPRWMLPKQARLDSGIPEFGSISANRMFPPVPIWLGSTHSLPCKGNQE